jgi:EAL domain-containing protein (putative c-di-GMP-specific phosphodiesterase class I)
VAPRCWPALALRLQQLVRDQPGQDQPFCRCNVVVDVGCVRQVLLRIAADIEELEGTTSAAGRRPETVLLSDLPTVALEMRRLRSLGIRMAIDDFGTGYTSLAHLQHLTVDEIKIDRSFVQQLPDGRDSSLVRMMTDLAHHLGVSIVAEGVETDEQLTALREIGCDSLQGFLIGRPLTVEQLTTWYQKHRSAAHPSTLNDAA